MAYRLLAGMDYNGKRGEPGDVVDDLPERSVPWLTKQGYIEVVKSSRKTQEDSDANV